MIDLREAAKRAVEALEVGRLYITSTSKIKHPEGTEWYDERTDALREALAKPEWVGLTDEEIINCSDYPISFGVPISFAKAIEAKLKEKNSGSAD